MGMLLWLGILAPPQLTTEKLPNCGMGWNLRDRGMTSPLT